MTGLSVVNRLSNSRSVDPCGCSDGRLELEQIHHVDETQLETRRLLAQDGRRGQRLHRRHVAAGRQHDVRLLALVRARALPDADALRAVDDRLVDGRELQVLLLVRDDHVDVVGAAQAVVHHRQERVGVGRKIDAHHRCTLVGDEIDEPRVLMREPVVVLPPDGGGEQDVLGRHRHAPRDVVLADVQPLGVLVDHGIDHVRERFVGVEQPVPSGEQIPLQPADQRVLGQHLHHAPVRRQFAAVGVFGQHVGHPRLLAGAIEGLQSVRRGLVGAEDAEVRRVVLHHVAQEFAERLGVFVLRRAARGAPARRTAGSREA